MNLCAISLCHGQGLLLNSYKDITKHTFWRFLGPYGVYVTLRQRNRKAPGKIKHIIHKRKIQSKTKDFPRCSSLIFFSNPSDYVFCCFILSPIKTTEENLFGPTWNTQDRNNWWKNNDLMFSGNLIHIQFFVPCTIGFFLINCFNMSRPRQPFKVQIIQKKQYLN